MRTLFLGTTDFAVAVLERLAASPHRPALVVTRPDRPRGRGRLLLPPPVADAARHLGIELAQPVSVNDPQARARIAEADPEVIAVCAFGGLIKEPLLSDYLMLNVHPSLLPRWRGAAPVERAIMAADAVTGVTIMGITAGLDSGPIYRRAQMPIRPDDTYGSLAPRLQHLGGVLLVEVLDELTTGSAGGVQPVEQPEADVTYAEKITPEDRRLDPARPADELERVVRALSPHIGAWVELQDGMRLGVLQARGLPSDGGPAGQLILGPGDVPVLVCGRGELQLLRVKPPGRNEMSGSEWQRGYTR